MPKCCPRCPMYEECEDRNECCPKCDYYSNGECLYTEKEAEILEKLREKL